MTLPGGTAQLDEIEIVPLAPRRREWLETARGAWSLRRTKIGVALIVIVVAVAAFGPLVAPYSPTEFVGPSFQRPSAIAKLGTDYLGRDVLTRVLYGGRTAIALALAATAIGMFFGMLLGILSGYSSRLVDETIMRLLDVLLAFPSIIFALLIIAMVGPRPWLIAIAVGISHVPGVARVARGVTLEVAGHDFIKSAKALGVSKLTIMRSQILPNITTPMFVRLRDPVWLLGQRHRGAELPRLWLAAAHGRLGPDDQRKPYRHLDPALRRAGARPADRHGDDRCEPDRRRAGADHHRHRPKGGSPVRKVVLRVDQRPAAP